MQELLSQIQVFLTSATQRLVRESPLGVAAVALAILAGAWLLAQVAVRLRRGAAMLPRGTQGGTLHGRGTLLRDAKRRARAGDAREAGHLFEILGDLDRAAEQYERARAYSAAAGVHERARRWARAAALHEKAGNLPRAAECQQHAGDHGQAAALFLRAGREIRAAEALEQARRYAEAAALCERAGSLDKAAALYERAGAYGQAAETLERHLLAFHGGGRADHRLADTLPAEAAPLLERCATLYRLAGQPARAAAVFLHWGAAAEAAQCFLEAGEPRRALELYREAGRLAEAMEVCQLIGAEAELQALTAEQFARAGRTRDAAEAWERAGDAARAADAYRELHEWERAGELFGRAGVQDVAGEMFEAAGLPGKAGAAYAAGGRWPDAGRCYREAGMVREAAAAMASGGGFYGAGALLAETGVADEAIAVLQKLLPESPDYAAGCLLLARLLLARDMPAPALVRLEDLVGHGWPGLAERAVEAHYLLGRAYEALERPEDALGQYDRVLAASVEYEDAADRAAALRQRAARPSGPEVTVPIPASGSARYRLECELGRGGMGIVYQARDLVLMRPVALKVLAPAIQNSPQARARFLQEARIAAGLRHPNIVTIYDASDADGSLCIAMELIEGTNLEQYLREQGPLAPVEVLALGRQICAGLAHAHAHNIVHADVKPANMLLGRAGTVHLTDFGLARAWDVAHDSGIIGARGTPLYIAPEQVRGEALDARTDVYGLGCTLYRMLAGAPPFPRGDIIYHHLHEAPPPLRGEHPGVPEALEAAILRCLAKRPEGRFPSAAQVLDALEAALPAAAAAQGAAGPATPPTST